MFEGNNGRRTDLTVEVPIQDIVPHTAYTWIEMFNDEDGSRKDNAY